ncbi:DUF4349 domain-containing protein [Streptomyces sp. SID8356]|uniref:DUF4349 domain-containing protein n=1 Tax=unclassified Streptomyces TaxID=2593676 RepID=UPI00036228BA|nr:MULTISPECIES: DUF4349 domain-containing protein [unclassified Streptomyces]MYT38610.1 DUF4349 domain-containing protein [Streptomyces sp. SID8356]
MTSDNGRLLARPPRACHHRRARLRAALGAGALGAVLLVGGCGAADNEGSTRDLKADAPQGLVDEGYAPEGADGAGSAAASAAPAEGAKGAEQRQKAPKPGAEGAHVIRTTELSVEVESAPKAAAAARSTVEASGGLVATETTERIDDRHETSHLVLRVPQDRYQEVLGRLAGSGKVLSRSSNAKDVTDQVVDVESRIATQRASVARVRELMEKAEKLSDVVTLEGELSSRQADLESLLAQQASLKDRTSLATVTLDLTEPDAPRTSGKDDDPGFLDALGGGWDAFVTMFRWIAVALGASAPFLVTAALALVVWRTVRARRTARTAAEAPRPEAEPEARTEAGPQARPEAGSTPAP